MSVLPPIAGGSASRAGSRATSRGAVACGGCGVASRLRGICGNAVRPGTDPVMSGAAVTGVGVGARGWAAMERGAMAGKAKSFSTPDVGLCPNVVSPGKTTVELRVADGGRTKAAPFPVRGASTGGDCGSGRIVGSAGDAGGTVPSIRDTGGADGGGAGL